MNETERSQMTMEKVIRILLKSRLPVMVRWRMGCDEAWTASIISTEEGLMLESETMPVSAEAEWRPLNNSRPDTPAQTLNKL